MKPHSNSFVHFLRREWVLLASYSTTLFFMFPGHSLTETAPGMTLGIVLFVWLFTVMLGSSFAVVRHADHLADILKEPLGTLILPLAVTGM